MEPDAYLRDGKVLVWKETFAVIKAKRPMEGAFATLKDKKELTVIIDQKKISKKDVIHQEPDWKLLTFDMVLPFGVVGFLAKISSALAKEDISIFALSAYSTDHLLIKKKDLKKAIKTLEKLGCKVVECS